MGNQVIDQNLKSSAIANLRQHDPNFDETAFCQRVSAAFLKIQQAWIAQDLKAVQVFVSDGVAERFVLQFAEQRDAGYRDQMDNIAVLDTRIADVHCAGVFDEIAVRIAAQSSDYRVSLADPKQTQGSTAVESFVEIWSFLRKRGAVTDKSHDGLMEGHCPNCGALVTVNESAQCEHCKALLRSGQYDWVLTEITQASEWDPDVRYELPGLEPMQQQDPGFDPQALEDRASVIFWRKAAADRTGKIDPIRKVATDDFCRNYQPHLHPTDNAPRQFIGEGAVGGVKTLAILPADDQTQMDRAIMLIRWSGKQFSQQPGGTAQVSGATAVRSTFFILGRKPGIQTDADKSISSAHCPNCGAPESTGIANACEFCGTVLNDGSRNWVLLNILSPSDSAAQQMLNDARHAAGQLPKQSIASTAPLNPAGLLAWSVKVAAIDGSIDDSERKLLTSFAANRGIPTDHLDATINAAAHGNLVVPQPQSSAEAYDWLRAITVMSLADGNLDRNEYALIRTLGEKVGLGDYDVKLFINQTRTEQLNAARKALRDSRSAAIHPININ